MGGCGTARGQAQFSGKGFIGIEVEGVFQVVILLVSTVEGEIAGSADGAIQIDDIAGAVGRDLGCAVDGDRAGQSVSGGVFVEE